MLKSVCIVGSVQDFAGSWVFAIRLTCCVVDNSTSSLSYGWIAHRNKRCLKSARFYYVNKDATQER